MSSATITRKGTGTVTGSTRDDVRAALISLMESVPFADDGDGYGMVSAILDADNWQDFASDSSTLPNASAVAGRDLRVREIVRRESDIEDGSDSGLDLPWYIVIDSTDVNTGDQVMWQTSAATVITKLVKLHSMGKLPAVVRTSEAAKKTKRGFTPVNLSVLSVTE